MGEKSKVSIRNIRRDANKQLEDEQKNKLISEDDRDGGKKEADELTKSHVLFEMDEPECKNLLVKILKAEKNLSRN